MINRSLFFLVLALLSATLFADKRVVNVYVWGGEIPKKAVQQFEKETGIHVNFSTYDSNETMYTKLKASKTALYDVVLPSAYFVERMRNQGMLLQLDHQRLPNLKNLEKRFQCNDYDPDNQYSIPLIWGATGIFFNKNYVKKVPGLWQDLWQNYWRRQLLLLDDPREVFAIALMSLGYNPNDSDPRHIKAAYLHLLRLVPNIKLFASESVQAIIIDSDANLGMAWNGDAYKAQKENKQIGFHLPESGFVIWVDCLAIPKGAPHPQEAYQFINYLLKAETGATIALSEGHAITNSKGKSLLPSSMRDNSTIYPSAESLKHGHFQRDLGEETLKLYSLYWQQLKLAF